MSKTRIHRAKKSSRLRRIFLIAVLLLIGLAGAGFIYWNLNKKEIIRHKLEERITEKSKGLYKVDFEDMQLDEVGGFASFTNLKVEYDNAEYAAIEKTQNVPPTLFKLNIPEISISGVKTPKALMGEEIVAKKLELNGPRIEIIYTNKGKDAKRSVPDQQLYRLILGDLKLIKVDTIVLKNATITTKSLGRKKEHAIFKNTTILLTDVLVDSISNDDSSRIMFSKSMDFKCQQIAWSARNLYDYTINMLSFNSTGNTLRVEEVNINPRLGEDAFVKSRPFQADRLDMNFQDIRLKNVDAENLMNEIVIADVMEVGKGSIKVYRDLNIPRDKKNRIGTYPHQMIMDVPIPFVIEKAYLRNIYIGYREKNDLTKMVGDVKFMNTNLSIQNLTNDPYYIKKNSTCRIDVSSSLLGLSPVKAVLLLPLGNKDGKFTVEGTVGGGDATQLNVLSEPMGMARIRKGTISSMDFKFTGNNTRADGTVKILYDDLRIDMLEMDESKGGLDKKGLTSFIGNMILKNENPDDGGAPRIAEVHHERDINRSLYNLVWKSIMSGINTSIGNKKKMRRP